MSLSFEPFQYHHEVIPFIVQVDEYKNHSNSKITFLKNTKIRPFKFYFGRTNMFYFGGTKLFYPLLYKTYKRLGRIICSPLVEFI